MTVGPEHSLVMVGGSLMYGCSWAVAVHSRGQNGKKQRLGND